MTSDDVLVEALREIQRRWQTPDGRTRCEHPFCEVCDMRSTPPAREGGEG